MHRVHRRQVSSIPAAPVGASLSGVTTVQTAGANTNSLLVANGPTAAAFTGTTPVFSVSQTPSSSTAAPEETSSAAATSASSSSLSIGTVVGICFGVFIALAVVLLLVFYVGQRRRTSMRKRPYTKQRDITGDADRRKSGREAWVKMSDDKNEKPDAYAMKRTTQVSVAPSSTIVPQSPITIERSMTVKSAKSTKTFKSLGYGAGLGFSHTFKTAEAPPQLEFTDSSMGDGIVHPFARTQAPVSWDSRTVAEGESYLSLKRDSDQVHFGLDSPVSSLAISHPTPPAVETNLHQWEKAEVVSPGVTTPQDAYGGVVEDDWKSSHSHSTIRKASSSRNPFTDMTENPFHDPSPSHAVVYYPQPNNAPSAASSSQASYFPVQTELTPRAQQFSNAEHEVAHQHERNESNERAMASLIAALDITPEQAQERLSAAAFPTPRASAASSLSFGMHSKISEVSESETIDEENYRRFPLPPDRLGR